MGRPFSSWALYESRLKAGTTKSSHFLQAERVCQQAVRRADQARRSHTAPRPIRVGKVGQTLTNCHIYLLPIKPLHTID
jgi:hypothetical protein